MINGYTENRLEFIDITKGIGIFLVISSHVYGQFMSWALPFYIPIFFIVSGYCTSHPVMLQTKYKKLIIPYFFFSFILLSMNKSLEVLDFIGILYSRWCIYPLGSDSNIYLLRSGNGPLWFLTSMYVSYIFFFYIQRSTKPILIISIYIATTYLLSLLPILLPWSIDTAFLMASFIYYGVIIRKNHLLNKLNYTWLIGLTILYIVFRYNCGYINLSVRIYGRSLITSIPAAMLGSVILMKISYYIEGCFIGKIISMIGRHSLSIFCLHVPFITVWKIIAGSLRLNIPHVLYGILCIFFVMSISYPISLFLDKYVLKSIIK